MAVKRRVIWMSDENWAELNRVVERLQTRTKMMGLTQRITPSLVILDCLDRGHFRAEREARAAQREWPEDPPPIFEPGFNSRPFTPVPKKGK